MNVIRYRQMSGLRAFPLFYGIMVALGAVCLGEGVFLLREWQAVAAAERVATSKARDFAALANVIPFPDAANTKAIEADLASAQRTLATLRETSRGHGERAREFWSLVPPLGPTDAYFDLAAFVEKTRIKAADAGIDLKAEERFGFAIYANHGPESVAIPQVFRQRQVAQYLLETLFMGHPQSLVSLERERPLVVGAGAVGRGAPSLARATSGADDPTDDFFRWEESLADRAPGLVSAQAFRLTFTGKTDCLRIFINRLAAFELPLIVRRVEVAPAMGMMTGKMREERSLPLGDATVSRFTVTIEFVELTPLAVEAIREG